MKGIYIRVSSDEQDPTIQLKDIMTLSGNNYILYKDKQSAFREDKERESFEQLKKDILKGKINELFVWDLDRIYRNRIKLKEFIMFTKINNCKLYSYRQKFINQIQELALPPEFNFIRDMMLNNLIELLGWIAQDESEKKSQRVKNAIRIDEQGRTRSYKGNPWGRRAISQDNIDRILLLRNQGKTISQIASEVYYYDRNNNKKFVSRAVVHKSLKNFS